MPVIPLAMHGGVLVCAALSVAGAAPGPGTVAVTDDGGRSIDVPPHWGHGTGKTGYLRRMALSNGQVTYGLRYFVLTSAPGRGASGVLAKDSSGLGLDQPTSANWFREGFIEVGARGDRCGLHRATFEVKAFGDRGWVRASWALATGPVTADFVLLPDRPYLYVQVGAGPDVHPLDVRLICYPCGFKRQRVIHTPDGHVDRKTRGAVRKQAADLRSPTWWALYADTSLDYQHEPAGAGPCSLVLLSADTARVSTAPGYGVWTTIRAARQVVRFAVRELPQTANARALEQTRSDAATVGRDLLRLFPPTGDEQP